MSLVLVYWLLRPNSKCDFWIFTTLTDMRTHRPKINEQSGRRAALALGGVLAALLTTGCGAASPGDAEARNYLNNRFAGCPLWTISNARKVDSIQRGDQYQLDYEATLTLRSDFARTSYAGVRNFWDDPRNKPCKGEMGNVVAGMAGAVDLQTGQTILRGAILLIRSEQGWRLLRGPEEKFIKPTN